MKTKMKSNAYIICKKIGLKELIKKIEEIDEKEVIVIGIKLNEKQKKELERHYNVKECFIGLLIEKRT